MTKTKTRQIHLLVTEDVYQQLRLTAFYKSISMAEIINRGIAQVLVPVKKEKSER